MREHKVIKIDSEKLERLLIKRGYNRKRAGVELGRSQTFFSKVLEAGEMTYITAKAIEAVFNIKMDEYEIKPEEPAPPEFVIKPEIRAELLELIKQAVREVLAE